MAKIELDIKNLGIIMQKISDYLNSKSNKVDILKDSYLLIGSDDWYNFVEDNIKPEVGSLKDDWESIQKNIMERDIVTPVDLDRLSSLLRAISHQITNGDS